MEQSKLISEMIANLKISYPYYFEKLTKEEFIGLISIYQSQFLSYERTVLMKAINNLIARNKFMPTVAEIHEECKNCQKSSLEEIIKKMQKANYFKNEKELEKVYLWLDKGIIPTWLKKEMKKYSNSELVNKEQKMLNI